MYLTLGINQIKNKFIHDYKHPYIDPSFYESILIDNQIYFFQQLFNEIGQEHDLDVLFQSLLHIKTSIDIHDQVDIQFDSNISKESLEINQLKVLVGDYHSALFYKLLTKNNLLDALYHFIDTIKDINQSKMTLIHEDTATFHPDQIFNELEMIYVGLYDAIDTFYNISNYKEKWKPLIYFYLIYDSTDTFWVKLLANKDEYFLDLFENRKKFWIDQINDFECSLS